MEGCLAEKI